MGVHHCAITFAVLAQETFVYASHKSLRNELHKRDFFHFDSFVSMRECDKSLGGGCSLGLGMQHAREANSFRYRPLSLSLV